MAKVLPTNGYTNNPNITNRRLSLQNKVGRHGTTNQLIACQVGGPYHHEFASNEDKSFTYLCNTIIFLSTVFLIVSISASCYFLKYETKTYTYCQRVMTKVPLNKRNLGSPHSSQKISFLCFISFAVFIPFSLPFYTSKQVFAIYFSIYDVLIFPVFYTLPHVQKPFPMLYISITYFDITVINWALFQATKIWGLFQATT